MSDLTDTYNDPHEGKYIEFVEVARFGKALDTGGVFIDHRSTDKEPFCFTEKTVYDVMVKDSAWQLAMPKDIAKRAVIEAKIMHYALACIQQSKIENGIPLDAPFTPHPNVKIRATNKNPEIEITYS